MTTFISHGQANTLILYMSLFFAYVAVVTTAHFFKAWVALKMGDPTAAEQGFLSWHPSDHIDFLGMFYLFAVGLGWGRHVPINTLNIHGKNRTAKIICAQISDSAAYIGIGIIATLALVLLFGGPIINFSSYCAFRGILSYQELHALYPLYSSTHIALGVIALCAMYLSIMLGALQFLINCFHLFMQRYIISDGDDLFENAFFWIAPLCLMFFLAEPLRYCIMQLIAFISILITHILGLF